MRQSEYTFLNKEFWCWYASTTLTGASCRLMQLDIESLNSLPAIQYISARNVDILFYIMMELGIQS